MRLGMVIMRTTMVFALVGNEYGLASDRMLVGTPGTVHKKFNVAARKFKSKQRMVLSECSGDDVRICNYAVTGNLGLMAWSQKGSAKTLKSVTLIYAKGSEAIDMLLAMGTLMQVYSPRADSSERGVAMKTLTEGMQERGGKSSVELQEITYSVSNLGKMGLWFTVKAH